MDYRCFLKWAVTAFLLFAVRPCFAANGYYITLQGDTIRGDFPVSEWIYNPEVVDFFPNGVSARMSITPLSARAFTIRTHDHFISYRGTRTLDSEPGKHLTEDINIFLRQLGTAEGLTFYILTDNRRQNFYYSDSRTVTELIFTGPGSGTAAHRYRQQLFELLKNAADTAWLMEVTASLDYTEEGFHAFIEELNGKRNASDIPPVTGLIAEAGIGINFFDVTGNNENPSVPVSYGSGSSFVGGVGYLGRMNRQYHRYFYIARLRFYTFDHQGSVNRFDGTVNSRFKSDLVIAPSLNVGYHLTDKVAVKSFAFAGIGVLVLVNSSETRDRHYYNGGHLNEVMKRTNTAFGVHAGAGVMLFTRYILTVTYTAPTAVFSHQTYTGNHSSVQLTVGYRFGK